jgi:hypothetical protein
MPLDLKTYCRRRQMKLETPAQPTGVTVAVRRQTPQEQRRFEAALELLLTELVRRKIAGREGEEHGEIKTTR